MKIMFITPPYHCGVVEVAGRWIPLQYVYLAGAARAAGHECIIYDAMSLWHDHEQITTRIATEQPDVVCMSVITATHNAGMEVLENAKRVLPGVTTVLGGVHAHFMARSILEEHPQTVDFIIRGEGEYILPEALEHLGKPDELRKVRGLVFVDGDDIVLNPPALRHQDLDILPTAFDLLDWPTYRYFVIENSRLGAVATSRGCPHGCTFCSQQVFWERTWRARAPAKVVDEIATLKNRFGVNVVLFSDEYPTASRKRWEELLDLLIKADLGVFLLMETRVEDILRDQDILWKYRRAGIVHVYMGVEATDQDTLDLMKKDITVEQSRQALALVTQHGMVTETSLVLGFPHETPESINRTLEMAKHFNPDNAHFLAITPWPYTELYKEFEPYIEVRDYSKYNLIEPIATTKTMSLADLDHAMVDCYRKFYMGKMKDFLTEPDPFRRHYLVEAARLIMGSSFIRKKMATGAGMPKEIRKMIQKLRNHSSTPTTDISAIPRF